MSLGSWLRDRPHWLERAFQGAHQSILWLKPLFVKIGYRRAERWLHPFEAASKGVIFDCRMCGQCILHSTGMTCPMTCPKKLRNGPCGGVRANGHCEVDPEMKCVWVEATKRASRMPLYGEEIMLIQPPVNRLLKGSSAWINMMNGKDAELPPAWKSGKSAANTGYEQAANG